MKILFLGNSHTYFNDMPATCAALVKAATGTDCSVTMLSHSRRDLSWHRREYFELRFNLLYGGYDYCVIQQAAHPYPPIEATLGTGADIIDLCHRCGVKPVVYMTWAEKRFPENQQKMIDTCERLAAENNALLAPIGRVWQSVQQARPDIELYHTDGEHAGPYGDFLIAAVLCRLLTGSVSDSVSGMGFSFVGRKVEWEKPVVLEDKNLICVELDREQTDFILGAVNA